MTPITRRDALKKIYQAIVGIGAGAFISYEDLLLAQDAKINQPPVVWLHGTSCSGCSCSFLNIEDIPVIELITKFTDLVFHSDLSAATGTMAINVLENMLRSNRRFIFVFEGAIPVGMPHACLLNGVPIMDWVNRFASKATACVAAGTCAVYGGVTKMDGMKTGNMSLSEFLDYRRIRTPLVNLPNCPMKPEYITYVLLHLIKKRSLPTLDNSLRPVYFYDKTVHERCILYRDFQEDNFAEYIGDKGCLARLGCQGPVTHSDCMIYGHNGNTNNCIKCGHPCIGCSSSMFPRKIMLHKFNDPRSLTIKT